MYIPGYNEEPFQWYKQMRATDPVVRDVTNVHVFTYAECKRILNDFKVYSSQFRDFMDPEMAKQLNEISSPSILIMDPPRHTKLRNLVNRAFTPKRVLSYEKEIRNLAVRLMEDFPDQGSFDFVRSLSYPLPVMVISRILGVPEKDMERFKVWSDKLAEALGSGVDMGVQAEMSVYFSKLMKERKEEIGEDLLTLLMEAEIDGEKLSEREIIGFSILLLAAGNETTTNLLTNSIITMTENPGTFQYMSDNRSDIPLGIEEVLRYRSPVQSTRRYVKEDSDVGGVRVQKGDMVFVYLGSANRDEKIFEKPEEFLPWRKENRHIAFGEGVHFCLGAPLARLEAKVVMEELTNRFGDIQAINPDQNDRLQAAIMYGFNRLISRVTLK